jgi:hypothetical protein
MDPLELPEIMWLLKANSFLTNLFQTDFSFQIRQLVAAMEMA